MGSSSRFRSVLCPLPDAARTPSVRTRLSIILHPGCPYSSSRRRRYLLRQTPFTGLVSSKISARFLPLRLRFGPFIINRRNRGSRGFAGKAGGRCLCFSRGDGKMTTVAQTEVRCAICGKTGYQTVLGSHTLFSRPDDQDLDTRTRGLMRPFLEIRVQACPACGYCAPEIAEGMEGIADVLQSDRYRQQWRHSAYPALANHFLCHAQLQEHRGQYANAGWTTLHAAWVCDDADNMEAARNCRKAAVRLWVRARARGQCVVGEAGAEDLLLAELLRRAGEFPAALAMCRKGRQKDPGETIATILRFEELLIDRLDTAPHTMEETFRAMSEPPIGNA